MKISRTLLGLLWLFGVTTAAHAASNPNRLEVRLVNETSGEPERAPGQPILTAADVLSAKLTPETEGQVGVAVRLTPAGAAKFRDASAANVGKRFAVIVDGTVIAAPKLRDPITGNGLVISSRDDEAEAQALVNSLNRARQ